MFDQTGHPYTLTAPPKRIISLVPSQTELLFHLGLGEAVVGITKFCIHPDEWFRNKTRVGGTKHVDLDRIRALQPDLIIGNKEENTREDIEALRKDFPVWVSDVNTIADALDMITAIGEITGRPLEAASVAGTISDLYAELLFTQSGLKPLRIAYLIWENPYMAAAKNTFIDAMLHALGWVNVFSNMERYPETDLQELADLAPDAVLLSSEPYPFTDKQRTDIARLLPGTKVVLVDGEYFSWYGARMREAFGYFRALDRSIRIQEKP